MSLVCLFNLLAHRLSLTLGDLKDAHRPELKFRISDLEKKTQKIAGSLIV